MVSRSAQKPRVIRVAEHDAVQNHDIGRLDPSWIGGNVVKPTLRASLDRRRAHEPHRFLVVTGRKLEVRCACSAMLQERDLHLADSAADLEDGGPFDPAPLEKGQHALRRHAPAA